MRPKPVIRFEADPPAAQALALGLVTKADLLRLKAIARLHARGLPAYVGWTDLLQEAFARALEGRRRRPAAVPMVAFIAEVMRSLRSDHLRRARQEAGSARQIGPALAATIETPEEQLAAEQELARIHALFADDMRALQLLAGLGAGLKPEEICLRSGMSATEYDSTRKRVRRAMLREGLRYPLP